MGTGLAVAAIYGSGTPEQLFEWVPQCFGDAADPKVAAFCSTEPEAGSDVGAMRTRARYDEATDEWVLTGQKAYATNGGIANVHVVTAVVDPDLGSRGQAAFIVPPGTPGLVGSKKLKKLGLRASHTADVFLDDVRVPGSACSAARRGWTSGWPGPGRAAARPARRRCVRSSRPGPTVGAQALGIARAAYEYSLEYAKNRVTVRPADHREPGDRVHPGRHAYRDRRRTAAGLAGGVDGPQRAPVRGGRGFDEQAEGERGRRPRDRAGRADPRRCRLPARTPGRAVVPRLQDLHDLRGYVRNPAPRRRPRDLRHADR